jgi:hypothetical protein
VDAQLCAKANAVRHAASKDLFRYWETLRGSRPAPERGEIEPAEIRSILGDTFILEISLQFRTVSFRLAGTRLCSAYGRELKGLGFLALWSEDDNYDVAKLVSRVYRDNQPVLVGYAAQNGNGRFLEYEMLLLPLAKAADGNARILGIASPRTTPYWLGNEPLVTNHLRSSRSVPAATPTDAPMAQELAPSEPTRRVQHLTVLEGGKRG